MGDVTLSATGGFSDARLMFPSNMPSLGSLCSYGQDNEFGVAFPYDEEDHATKTITVESYSLDSVGTTVAPKVKDVEVDYSYDEKINSENNKNVDTTKDVEVDDSYDEKINSENKEKKDKNKNKNKNQ